MGRMVICMRCGGEVIAEVFFGWEKRGMVLFVSILVIDFRIRRGEI